jgi:hypothetical protein
MVTPEEGCGGGELGLSRHKLFVTPDRWRADAGASPPTVEVIVAGVRVCSSIVREWFPDSIARPRRVTDFLCSRAGRTRPVTRNQRDDWIELPRAAQQGGRADEPSQQQSRTAEQTRPVVTTGLRRSVATFLGRDHELARILSAP